MNIADTTLGRIDIQPLETGWISPEFQGGGLITLGQHGLYAPEIELPIVEREQQAPAVHKKDVASVNDTGINMTYVLIGAAVLALLLVLKK